MTISEAFKHEKVMLALTMCVYDQIEQFIAQWVLNSERYILLLKKQPTYYTYSRDGGSWTRAGAEEMVSYIKIKMGEDTQYDPLPTGGPDFSNTPNGPFEHLEHFLLQTRLSSRNYATQVSELLKACYQNLSFMGADFRELTMEVGTEMLRLSATDQVDWDKLQYFNQTFITISKALNEEVETTKSIALKDGSTFAQMSAYITEAVKDKTLTKEKAGLAHKAYATWENQNKAVALKKMRAILKEG